MFSFSCLLKAKKEFLWCLSFVCTLMVTSFVSLFVWFFFFKYRVSVTRVWLTCVHVCVYIYGLSSDGQSDTGCGHMDSALIRPEFISSNLRNSLTATERRNGRTGDPFVTRAKEKQASKQRWRVWSLQTWFRCANSKFASASSPCGHQVGRGLMRRLWMCFWIAW